MVTNYLLKDSIYDRFGDPIFVGRRQTLWVWGPNICWKTAEIIGLVIKYLLEDRNHDRFNDQLFVESHVGAMIGLVTKYVLEDSRQDRFGD